MNTSRTLKASLALTAILVVPCVAVGWSNHTKISGLLHDQQSLKKKALATGLQFQQGTGSFVRTKRPRINRAEEARKIASEFIRQANEMSALGPMIPPDDRETWNRIDDQMERIMGMDGQQLKILIESVRTSEELEDAVGVPLLSFAISRLAVDHPQDALRLLSRPANAEDSLNKSGQWRDSAIGAIIAKWARTDKDAAREWCVTNPEKLPEESINATVLSLISSVKADDPRLALELADRFESAGKGNLVPNLFKATKRNAEAMTQSLALLREWRERPGSKDWLTDEVFEKSLTSIMEGERQSTDFSTFTGWVETAGLNEEEFRVVQQLTRSGGFRNAEPGPSMEWAAKVLPPHEAGGYNWEKALSASRSNPDGLLKWLESTPPSAARNTAARVYAQTIFEKDRDEAMRWLMTVPEEDQKMETLKRFLHRWPKDDEAGRNAFAEKYAIPQ